MNFMDHIPEHGFGIGMDVATNEVFLSFNGTIVPLDEDTMDKLIVALMHMMHIQETKKTARYN